MSVAASWIRVADANRPIGAHLRNSIGQKYVLTPSGRDVRLQTSNGMIQIPPGQDAYNYGQVAIKNMVLSENASGRLLATFRLRVREPSAVAAEIGALWSVCYDLASEGGLSGNQVNNGRFSARSP